MLRAAGRDFDVDAFLKKSSGIRTDHVWRRGDMPRHGPVNAESGFSSAIADSEDAEEVVKRVSMFLSGCSHLIADLAASGAATVIDISLVVGSERHYSWSIRFDPGLLQQFAQLRVDLQISGYPVSDEHIEDT